MTNQPIQTASTQRTKRDKYPARSARIITAGIALASTLGLSSAYTIAAQAKVTEGLLPNNATVDPAQQVVAQAPAVNAPTQPAAAAVTPAAAPIATAPPAIQAPVVLNSLCVHAHSRSVYLHGKHRRRHCRRRPSTS